MNRILAYLQARAVEPSTYAGLAAAIGGAGMAFRINEAPAIAEGVAHVGGAVASSGWIGGIVAAMGLIAAVVGEKRGK